MPCESVAVLSTRIAKKMFNELTTPELLLEQVPALIETLTDEQIIRKSVSPGGISILTSRYQIDITRDGVNVVTYGRDRTRLKAFETKLAEILAGVQAVAVQRFILGAVSQLPNSTVGNQYLPDGTMLVDIRS